MSPRPAAVLRAERDGKWSAWACEQMEAWARAQDRLSREAGGHWAVARGRGGG